MSVDNKVPYGEPGVAAFDKESWGNEPEWLYGDTPPLAQTTIDVEADGADVEISFLDVLAADGTAAAQDGGTAAARANYIAATTITIPDGTTKSVPVYRAGHFSMDALGWAASYDTDAKKKVAFEGSVSPTIFVSKAKHDSDAIY